jgi:hypothetical protein
MGLDIIGMSQPHFKSMWMMKLRAFLLDGPTPPEEKNGPKKSKAPRGRDPSAHRKKL